MYVVVSKATSRKVLKILVCEAEVDSNGDSIVNVVYKEVFQNLWISC